MANRLAFIASLAVITALASFGARAEDVQEARFFSERVDGFLTTDDSKLLSGRAMMQGAYPFFAKSWLPAARTAPCTTALLQTSQIKANFPMTDAQRNDYADLLRTGLANAKPQPVTLLANAPAKPGCTLVASFTVTPSNVPFILILEVSYAVLVPDSTGDRLAWAIAVRHSIQAPSEPPKTPIADFLLDDFRDVASSATARHLTEEKQRSILE
jgi:hypothetical protein